jgi:hypothetical protein
MSDKLTVENSAAEKVAYDLFQHIANVEGMAFVRSAGNGWKSADRKWILDTYAQCISAVRFPHKSPE